MIKEILRKGDRTRNRIAECAQMLFATRGFTKVTMQDICNETGLSRGGLYRYFASTSEIFIYLIQSSYAKNSKAFEQAHRKGYPTEAIFKVFLDSRLNYILDRTKNYDSAFKEFALSQPEGMDLMREYIDNSVQILSSLLDMGRQEGIFHFEDSVATAKHIHWVLLGLGLHNSILPLTPEEIEKQKKEIHAYLGYKPS